MNNFIYTTLTTAALFTAVLLSNSCALSKAIYLGRDTYTQRAAPSFSGERYNAENVNGVFPESVYIKTRTQTFNTYHYYILHEGRIWYKSIDGEKTPSAWTLFEKTGLPRTGSTVAEISADADEIIALTTGGVFYRYCFDKTIAHKSNVWLETYGWPAQERLALDERVAKNTSWAVGKRNSHVLYYEDSFGNQHHNGTMEIVTIYALLEDGQEICYADTGLPLDFSRNFIGPERGAFKAAALQASASTMFVINQAGEMYTRLADFDTAGCDPMWFKYTYIPYTSNLLGTDYFSNLNEWALPAEDWRPQPRIPLTGKAAVTRHITILQNGHGNGARELRVAGFDTAGAAGYWTKPIFADTWNFVPAPLFLPDDAILQTAKLENHEGGSPPRSSAAAQVFRYPPSGGRRTLNESGVPPAYGPEGVLKASLRPPATPPLGPLKLLTVPATPPLDTHTSLDKQYAGYRWTGGEAEGGWEYKIPNVNLLEGDCEFHITWRGETCVLKLHPVEMWTYLKRDYLPGRTGSPKLFFATLEIPEGAFASLTEDFARHLTERFVKNDRKLFQYTIAASNRYMIMRDTEEAESLWFLTDTSLSNNYTEFQTIRHIENFAELQRYYAPELMLQAETTLTPEILAEKIALNKQFLDALKHTIRTLKWSQLTAFKFKFGYIPAHNRGSCKTSVFNCQHTREVFWKPLGGQNTGLLQNAN
ncbi:MAG: hypothetical protein LBD20_08860 [Spirochaetaceae bacterium]|jgi:hypothetical protein|nr:hypothetical protein [Spirochaetaceae bacterium]